MGAPESGVVGIVCSHAHPLSVHEEETHLQSRHTFLSSHPLGLIYMDQCTLLALRDAELVHRQNQHVPVITGFVYIWFSFSILLV